MSITEALHLHINSTTFFPLVDLWIPEPNFRGTFSIISTCISTLAICVWSAVHLDISPDREHDTSVFVRKSGWLLVGLLAPDMLLYLAFSQWYNALWLLRSLYSQPDHPAPPNTWFYKYIVCRPLTRKHRKVGFYVVTPIIALSKYFQ